jgi:hypothetical protein
MRCKPKRLWRMRQGGEERGGPSGGFQKQQRAEAQSQSQSQSQNSLLQWPVSRLSLLSLTTNYPAAFLWLTHGSRLRDASLTFIHIFQVMLPIPENLGYVNLVRSHNSHLYIDYLTILQLAPMVSSRNVPLTMMHLHCILNFNFILFAVFHTIT